MIYIVYTHRMLSFRLYCFLLYIYTTFVHSEWFKCQASFKKKKYREILRHSPRISSMVFSMVIFCIVAPRETGNASFHLEISNISRFEVELTFSSTPTILPWNDLLPRCRENDLWTLRLMRFSINTRSINRSIENGIWVSSFVCRPFERKEEKKGGIKITR